MESAKTVEAAEEYNSCESGWTMYIGSPSHGDVHDYCYDHDHNHDDADDNEDSDDSMASDASSGPSHQFGHLEGTAPFTHDENYAENQYNHKLYFDSIKKTKKPVMEKRNMKKMQKEDKKEGTVFMDKRVKDNCSSYANSTSRSINAMKKKA